MNRARHLLRHLLGAKTTCLRATPIPRQLQAHSKSSFRHLSCAAPFDSTEFDSEAVLDEILASLSNGDQWYLYAGLPPHLENAGTLSSHPLTASPKTSTSTESSTISSHSEHTVSGNRASGTGQQGVAAWLCNLPSTSIESVVPPELPAAPGLSVTVRSHGSGPSSVCVSVPSNSFRTSLPPGAVSSGSSTSNRNGGAPQSPSALPPDDIFSPVHAETRPQNSNTDLLSRDQRQLLIHCRDADCSKVSVGKRADE